MNVELVIGVSFSLAVGGAIGWLLASRKAASASARAEQVISERDEARKDFDTLREKLSVAEQEKAAALARNVEIEKYVAEQKKTLDEAQVRLTDTFKSLAADALKDSNKSFLDLANEKFAKLKSESESDLKAREKAVENLVNPLSKALEEYQKESQAIAEKHSKEMGKFDEQSQTLAQSILNLQSETGNLVSALKRPQVRGRWGEIALRRTAELAGMIDHCDFYEQVSVNVEEGRLRPDMIVRLPSSREVIVDSKVSLIGFFEALEATDDEARTAALKRHASQLTRHVDQLASKDYARNFDKAIDMVVMFVPNDSFLTAATEIRPELLEYSASKGVLITTPSSFIALLKAFAVGWREAQLTENAREISILGQELYDRMSTLAEHFDRVGSSLEKSVESFNAAVSSIDARVFSSARKFKELGIGGKKSIIEIEQVDKRPRKVTQKIPREETVEAIKAVNIEDHK